MKNEWKQWHGHGVFKEESEALRYREHISKNFGKLRWRIRYYAPSAVWVVGYDCPKQLGFHRHKEMIAFLDGWKAALP